MGIVNFFTNLFGFVAKTEVKKQTLELFNKPSEYRDYYPSEGTAKPYARGLDATIIADRIEKSSGKRVPTVTIFKVIDQLRDEEKIYVVSYVERTGIPIYKKVQWGV